MALESSVSSSRAIPDTWTTPGIQELFGNSPGVCPLVFCASSSILVPTKKDIFVSNQTCLGLPEVPSLWFFGVFLMGETPLWFCPRYWDTRYYNFREPFPKCPKLSPFLSCLCSDTVTPWPAQSSWSHPNFVKISIVLGAEFGQRSPKEAAGRFFREVFPCAVSPCAVLGRM